VVAQVDAGARVNGDDVSPTDGTLLLPGKNSATAMSCTKRDISRAISAPSLQDGEQALFGEAGFRRADNIIVGGLVP
jgi:hypothetical protein